jgi:hypothetical protein
VLEAQEQGRVQLPLGDLLVMLRDPEPLLRRATAACIAAGGGLRSWPELSAVLIAAFTEEGDSEVQRKLLGALPRSAVPEIVSAAVEHKRPPLREVLAMLTAHFGAVRWDDVARIAEPSKLEIVHILLAYRPALRAPDELRWLCAAYRAAGEGDRYPAGDVRWAALSRMYDLLGDDVRMALYRDDQELLSHAFERALAAARADAGDGWDRDAYLHDLEYAAELLRGSRML